MFLDVPYRIVETTGGPGEAWPWEKKVSPCDDIEMRSWQVRNFSGIFTIIATLN